MENELTFVAPEGVYSLTEEHKPTILNPHIIAPPIYPTRLVTCIVRFPAVRHASGPGIAHFLGGGKDSKTKEKEKDKEKELLLVKEREDGKSVSSSGDPTDEETHSDPLTSPLLQNSTSTSPTYDTSKLFAPALGSTKKKSISRPKQNMRTTTSTFVTRLQSIDGLSRYLQSKQTDVTFLFYNCAKNFFWVELGSKTKVCPPDIEATKCVS